MRKVLIDCHSQSYKCCNGFINFLSNIFSVMVAVFNGQAERMVLWLQVTFFHVSCFQSFSKFFDNLFCVIDRRFPIPCWQMPNDITKAHVSDFFYKGDRGWGREVNLGDKLLRSLLPIMERILRWASLCVDLIDKVDRYIQTLQKLILIWRRKEIPYFFIFWGCLATFDFW